ncbi:MAG: FecR domain-containing protein [Gammaproteobacteria bacterium]|nr:FecR domain-containing protein [Gammaproteobacteria bacterium]
MNENTDDGLLDQALRAVRDDVPDAQAEAKALRRAATAMSSHSAVIDDYRALIPDYRAGTLSADRRLLFEEELNSSVALRRALRDAGRTPRARDRRMPGPRRNRSAWPWAVAAALAAAVGFALVYPALPVADQTRLARVDTSVGGIYRVADAGLSRLSGGDWVSGNEVLRTGKQGSTWLALDDGSVLEIEARTQLRLRRQRLGNRVHVDRGRVIVQAAAQGGSTLEVATDDVVVAVKGTVFGLSHGTKGTRVAVVEGEVEVRSSGSRKSLRAGEQFDTRGVVVTSVVDDVAWSADADRYADMLAEYTALRRELGSLLSARPRHSPRLLDLVPNDTVAYAAIPNAPAKIAKGYGMVRTRFVDAEVRASVDEYVEWLAEVAEYLGEETVFAFRRADAPPVLLAEVSREGLNPDLVAELELPEGVDVEVVGSPAFAREGVLSAWLTDDLLVVSSDPGALRQVEALQGGADHAFADGKLYARLKEGYARGAYYLGGMDLAPMQADGLELAGLGIAGAETLIVEGLAEDDRTRLTAEVRFVGDVPEALTWLDEPGPMGALEFFAPDAEIAAALLLGNVDELAALLKQADDAQASDELGSLDFVEDWVRAAGGELAIGFDGALLPTPTWQAVVEVYDREAFQLGIETAATRLNERAARQGDDTRATLLTDTTGPYPVVQLSVGKVSAHYAYFDGYLVAAASPALLEQARRTYESGVTLPGSRRFRELLPDDTYLDFSAVGYTEFGDLAGSVRTLLRDAIPAERQAVIKILADAGPWMHAVYREPDRIRVVVNGPLGLSLPELAILAGMSAGAIPGSGGT